MHDFGLEEPAAPTLILLHGLTDSGRCRGDAVDRWSAHYRIAAIDALGHGRSPRFSDEQLAEEPAEQLYAATIATIERIEAGGGPAVLVGHSMGGAMAAAVAARRPDLVLAAVLEDPAWLPVEEVPADGRVIGPGWLETHERFVANPVRELALGRLEHPAWPEQEMGPWAQAKIDTDPAFLAAGVVLVRDPWPELVARLRCPVLVVTGTENTIIGRSRATLDAIGNPAIEVVAVDEAGHCVRRDDGDGFHALVDPWIAARFGEASAA